MILVTASSQRNVSGSNEAKTYGGGLSIWGGAANIRNCDFTENEYSDELGGGGLNITAAKANVENCFFSQNTSTSDGGGIYFSWLSNVEIKNCTFIDNVAKNDGGGMYAESSANVINCTFTGNTASGNGGGIYISIVASVNMINCTLAMNTAKNEGAEIYVVKDDRENEFNFVNSVIWNAVGGYIRAYRNINMYNCAYQSNAVSAAENVTVTAKNNIENLNWNGREVSMNSSYAASVAEDEEEENNAAFLISKDNAEDMKLIDKWLTAEEVKEILLLSEAPDISRDQLGNERTGRPDIGAVEAALDEGGSGSGGNRRASSSGGCDAGLNTACAFILVALALCKWYNTQLIQ